MVWCSYRLERHFYLSTTPSFAIPRLFGSHLAPFPFRYRRRGYSDRNEIVINAYYFPSIQISLHIKTVIRMMIATKQYIETSRAMLQRQRCKQDESTTPKYPASHVNHMFESFPCASAIPSETFPTHLASNQTEPESKNTRDIHDS